MAYDVESLACHGDLSIAESVDGEDNADRSIFDICAAHDSAVQVAPVATSDRGPESPGAELGSPWGSSWQHNDDHRVSFNQSVKFFSKLNQFKFGYFDPINIFFDSKYKHFSG